MHAVPALQCQIFFAYIYEANSVMVQTDVFSGSILCACKFKLIYIVQYLTYAFLVSVV